MRRDANTLPTLEEMFEFLERLTMFLSNLSDRQPTAEQKAMSKPELAGRTGNQSIQDRRNTHNNANRPARSNWTPSEKCIKCGKNCYALFRCSEFEALTLIERARFVADKLLCRICFSGRHKTEQFFKVGCQKPQCGEKHNSFLCPLNARFKTVQSSKKEGTAASTAVSAIA